MLTLTETRQAELEAGLGACLTVLFYAEKRMLTHLPIAAMPDRRGTGAK